MLDISKVAYELYKQDWVDEHTTPEMRLRNIREYYAYVSECAEFGDTPDTYEDWLVENGHHGSLYVCYDEFCDMEYHDVGYMKSLLGEDEGLLQMYYDDVDVAYEEEAEDLAVDEILEGATMRSELFEKMQTLANEEFGCEVVRIESKSSFQEVFGFDAKEL